MAALRKASAECNDGRSISAELVLPLLAFPPARRHSRASTSLRCSSSRSRRLQSASVSKPVPQSWASSNLLHMKGSGSNGGVELR